MNPQNLRFLLIHVGKCCRHEGTGAAHHLAYAGRLALTDPRTGLHYNFSKKDDVEDWGMTGFRGTVQDLLDAAVSSESPRRKKAVEGRTLVVALAHELRVRERKRAAMALARRLALRYGVGVYYAIQRPPKGGDERNYHIHLYFTSRKVVGGNTLGPKTRILDSMLTGPAEVEAIRKWWTNLQNALLRKGGFEANLEHRSYKRLGINRTPSKHDGPARTAIKRRKELQAEAERATSYLATPRRMRPLPVPQKFLVPPPTLQPGSTPGRAAGVPAPKTPAPAAVPATPVTPTPAASGASHPYILPIPPNPPPSEPGVPTDDRPRPPYRFRPLRQPQPPPDLDRSGPTR
jgi:hypothetical protein